MKRNKSFTLEANLYINPSSVEGKGKYTPSPLLFEENFEILKMLEIFS